MLPSLLQFVRVPAAFAQDPCAGISGCTASSNQLVAFIPVVAVILLEIVSGLAVVCVVVAGAYYILNMGNEAMASKGKTGIVLSLVAFAIALSSQAIVSFVVTRAEGVEQYFGAPHIGIMTIVVDSLLYMMNVGFAISMFFFAYKLLLGRGQSSELDSTKQGLVWCIIGAIVMNLAYALVNAVRFLGF